MFDLDTGGVTIRMAALVLAAVAGIGVVGCGTSKQAASTSATTAIPSEMPQATSAANDLLTVDSAATGVDKNLATVGHDLAQWEAHPRPAWRNTLTTQVDTARHLTADHKATLLAKIASATTDDAQMLTPLVRMTIVADAEEFADATLSIVADKLAAAGKDVTAVRVKVDDAIGRIDPVAAQILSLEPAGASSNLSTLTADRDALKAASAEIKAAAGMARALTG